MKMTHSASPQATDRRVASGGALVAGARVHTMVWTDSLDYQVAKLEPTGLGETIDLSTGVYYPEDGGETDYTLVGYCGP